MNATSLLYELQAQDVKFSIAAGHIVIDAPRGVVTDDLLEQLRAEKPKFLRLLSNQWSPKDWRAFFDERAGIAEHDGGLNNAEAGREAFRDTVSEFLARNPPAPSGPEACVHCDLPIHQVGQDGIPVLAGEARHVWLHHDCHGAWRSQRSHHASQALAQMGVGN